MLVATCTSLFANVDAFAESKSMDGFNIKNGILKSVDKDISGEIEIPSTVKEIGADIFANCNDITKVTISGSVKRVGNKAFSGCESLTEVTIEEGVETIEEGCFIGCSNLKKVTIPSTIKEMGIDSFALCGKLTDVQFKAKNPRIGRWSFSGSPWLEEQRNGDGLAIVGKVLLDGKDASGSITIPSEVNIIQDGAFENNTNLEKVDLGNVTEVGENAFLRCSNLTSLVFPDSLKSIKQGAFGDCEKLSTVNIPNSVTSIEANAFSKNTKLTGNIEQYNKVQGEYDYKIEDAFDIRVSKYPNGWNIVDNKRFYKTNDGKKQTGWMDLNGNRYYFYSNGVQATGFIDLNGTHYYLEPNESGDNFGRMITGWKSIDGNWYYFSPQAEGDKVKGFMKTAWLNDNGNWYYFYSDGKMATGFINLNGTYYYLDESSTSNIGIMKTGWQKINGYWYYFNQKSDGGTEGVMSKGWRKIDGVWYYFYFGDGKMAADTWIDGYYVNGSGAWVK